MNTKGFSLTQMLVSVAVMGIIMTGMMTYVSSLYKSLRQISVKQAVIELNRQIQYAAGNETLCGCLMSGVDLSTAQATTLKTLNLECGASALKIEVNKEIESSLVGLRVSSISLSPFVPISASVGFTDLRLGFKYEGGVPPRDINERIMVKLKDGKISSCGEVRTSDLEVCAFVGGTYSEVTRKCNLPKMVVETPTPSSPGGGSTRFTSRTCAANEDCYVDVAIRQKTPNAIVTATATCYHGDGRINQGNSYTDRQIGYTNELGDYSYTGTWQCSVDPGSRCSQDWMVAGVKMGSHSWSCAR